jgi:hypothetical protein
MRDGFLDRYSGQRLVWLGQHLSNDVSDCLADKDEKRD